MAPWLPGPLAPLVPPTLNLQHLVAAPTLTQETSTKLSLKEGFASIWDKNWEAPMRPMAPHGPHDPPPLVPPALSLQHLVAAPTITQETSTKLPLSGPKIGKANSHLFTNGSPWSPWPPGPLAPLVPPALSLQHLVAVPTLSQETSTKLSPSGPKIEKANSPLFTNGSPMVPMAP